MNGNKNSVQKSFRLNLNNPDHAKIFQKLQNYNKNIYKSESMLIIEALKYFVTQIPPEFITEENAIEDRLIHESELNAAVDALKKYMDDTIHRELIGMIIGAAGFQRSVNADSAIQNNKSVHSSSSSTNDNDLKMDKETEALLEEIDSRWR